MVIEKDGDPAGRIVPVESEAAKRTGTGADLVALSRSWEPLNDGWAEGVEEANRIGNQPVTVEDPWER